MKHIYRRFKPIGDRKTMDKFEALCEHKNLSREDLIIILCAIELNQNIFQQSDLVNALKGETYERIASFQ